MDRRKFIVQAVNTLLLLSNAKLVMSFTSKKPARAPNHITLFLCGDVMTGRGIDQILPHPNHPWLNEPYVKDARAYVELAEKVNGPIVRPVDFSYVWGDALPVLQHLAPDVRIINLETSVTKSDDYWTGKGINYRMHPKNVPVLTTAKINCCALANNHVLDWGYRGLDETINTLHAAKILTAGAGESLQEAMKPAVIEVPDKGRVLIFSIATGSSGVPRNWAAEARRPGVNFLHDFSSKTINKIKENVRSVKRTKDIVVMSIHWGSNWGYEIPAAHIAFAHRLIDDAGVDIVHGHSSHHPRPIEIYRGKPIIYGCGDLLNDYEGITGNDQFRDDLGLMYLLTVDPATGMLSNLTMEPTQLMRLRLNRPSRDDVRWLTNILDRESRKLATRVTLTDEETLRLQW